MHHSPPSSTRHPASHASHPGWRRWRVIALLAVMIGLGPVAQAHVRPWDVSEAPVQSQAGTPQPATATQAPPARPITPPGPLTIGRESGEGLLEKAWLEERGATTPWTLAAAIAQPDTAWTPFQGVLNRGFGPSVVWIRLKADPAWRQQTTRAHLVIGAPYLDHVDVVFSTRQAPSWRSLETGDHHGWQPGMRQARQFVVDWTATDGDTVYLRVQTASTRLITVTLRSEQDVERLGAASFLGTGIVLGILVLLTAWAFSHAMLYRDRVTLAYGAYQLSALAMSLGLLGVTQWLQLTGLLAIGWADGLTTYGVLLTSLTGGWFHRVFLQQAQASRWALTFLDLSVLASAGLLLLALAGQAPLALKINGPMIVWVISLLVPLFVMPGFMGASRTGRIIRSAYAGLCALMISTLLGFLGVIDLGGLTLVAPVLHNLGTALLLLLLINLQRRELMSQTRRFQEAARLAELESSMVRDERDQKDRFLAMLTHELRTPLSVIRLVLDSIKPHATPADQAKVSHAQGATRDIDDVIERALQAERLERGNLNIQRQPCELESFVAGIALNHPSGDRLEVHLPKQALLIVTDPLWLRTLLANLVDNALKYSAPGTFARLEVSPQPQGDRAGVSFRVINEPGPAGKPDAEFVFQKFYRSQGARRTSGSGLGLYLVSGLARELGGHVQLIGDGPPGLVIFELWLPLQ
jgi:two-component system, sensor histidine kinase LadS